MSTKPIVDWQSPDSVPDVPKDETETFWVAVEFTRGNGETSRCVYDAQFVNKPVEFDEEGEPLSDDYFVTEDGDPVSAVGWHSLKEHADFDGYYDPLPFSDDYVLLGWAVYEKPDFIGR